MTYRPICRAVGVLVMAALVSGCGAPPLANAHPSAESLAHAVLAAVERGDVAALDALALDVDEFKRHVWPRLPAARPERNVPFSYVWGDLRQKSKTAQAATIARYQGRRYQLAEVRFAGERTDYPDARVHRDTVLVVREGSGTPFEIRLCGSLFEKDGRWKVFSYVIDD